MRTRLFAFTFMLIPFAGCGDDGTSDTSTADGSGSDTEPTQGTTMTTTVGGSQSSSTTTNTTTNTGTTTGTTGTTSTGTETTTGTASTDTGTTGDTGTDSVAVTSASSADTGAFCDPMDAEGEGPCDQFHGYKWNGTSCEAINGCECIGLDCANLFQDQQDCQNAYANCG